MTKEHDESDLWNLIGFVKISPIRYKTLKVLETRFMMPTEICKSANLSPAQVSNALHELKEKDLVICLNEDATKGRIYKNTPLGIKILSIIDDN
ncbi:MarR family transcriptional regulator [Methanobrevibacter sp.]|uniref:MarR family transcriptional regulator n=1 Tax=Methanobrevibacter sp. TaxID=66852 RepID=UPI00388DA8DA